MGLDVKVYKNIKETKNEEEADFTAFVVDKSWEHKIKNLQNRAHYNGERTDGSVSYSYGSHNIFREELLKIIERSDLLKDNDIDWGKLEKETEMPFYELINFADNEGCLDWETSGILYQNFVDYKEKAVKYLGEDNAFWDRYQDWLNVFLNGKEANSVVVFY